MLDVMSMCICNLKWKGFTNDDSGINVLNKHVKVSITQQIKNLAANRYITKLNQRIPGGKPLTSFVYKILVKKFYLCLIVLLLLLFMSCVFNADQCSFMYVSDSESHERHSDFVQIPNLSLCAV